MDPRLTMPCALITSPSTVELNSSSYSYETDPNRTVIATVAAEDFAISLWTRNAGNPIAVATAVTAGNFTSTENSLLSYVSPIFAGTFGSSNTQNDSMSDLLHQYRQKQLILILLVFLLKAMYTPTAHGLIILLSMEVMILLLE